MTSELEHAKKAAANAQLGNKDPARFPAWPKIEHLLVGPASHHVNQLRSADQMFARVLCYPPLGEPTVVAGCGNGQLQSVRFHVVLEVDASSNKSWEVELWHDGVQADDWRAMKFVKIVHTDDHAQKFLSLGPEMDDKKHHYQLELSRPTTSQSCTHFTIRFRNDAAVDWRWANDQFQVGNGSIYWQSTSKLSTDYHYYMTKTDPSLSIEAEAPQTSETLLWSVSCPVGAASGTKSTFELYRLGLATYFTKWFATCRLMTTWLRPRHGEKAFYIDAEKAVSVAFLRHDGLSVVVLALSGIDDTSVLLQESMMGEVVLEVRNDGTSAAVGKVLVAVAKSFEIANAAVMYHARLLSTKSQPQVNGIEDRIEACSPDDFDAKWMEEWYDGFGYCTWNALGQQLSEKSILEALEQFKRDGITLTSLIIDDNWQSLDNEGEHQGRRGMTRFEADAKAFPKGVKDLITTIKGFNPTIKRVALWHTMLGYWGAISPTGELAKEYKTVQALNNSGWDWTCIAGEDISRFYEDFYRFLKDCGVDGVKTDSQNSLDDLQTAKDRHNMIKEYQDAWTIAGLRHFSARQISCGSQCPVIMFHSMIKTNLPRIVARNSDDFFPDNPGSHPWHIFCNAHNSLIMQHLNILPDWDMFQTNHEWAYYHAAARCISGGPIYITDYPGKHDKALIGQMTAKTISGTTVILRPQRLGKTINAYASYAEPKLLKIGTYNGSAQTGTSIVGVFNVSQDALAEVLSLDQFPGTEQGEYIIRSHNHGRSTPRTSRSSKNCFLQVDLDVKGYDILTAYPVRTVETQNRTIRLANLGLVGKMTGAAAIVSEQIYSGLDAEEDSKVSPQRSHRARLWTSLKALGYWGVWIEGLESLSIQDDLFVILAGKPIDPYLVRRAVFDRNVLEINLPRAWEMIGGHESWSNELVVQLFVR